MTSETAVVKGARFGEAKMNFRKTAIVVGILFGTFAVAYALSANCIYPWVPCHKQTSTGINCECKFISCSWWGYSDGCP